MRYSLKRLHNLFVFCLVVLCVYIGDLALAEGQPPPMDMVLSNGTKISINNLSEAHTWYNTMQGNLSAKNLEIVRLENDLKIINYGINDKKTELQDAKENGLGAAVDGSNGSALAAVIQQMRKNNELWQIQREQIKKYGAIASKQKEVDDYAGDHRAVYAVYRA